MKSSIINEPSVDIIIVNWNSTKQLNECLKSLLESDLITIHIGRVVIVDNASKEFVVRKEYLDSLPLEIIQNANNEGFAAACNRGAKRCTKKYILFLNPDVKLNYETISRPVRWLETTSNTIGICGVRLLNDFGRFETSWANFPNLKMYVGLSTGLRRLFPRYFPARFNDSVKLDKSGYVDQISGAYFLVRKILFDEIRGFDERYFVYYEDVDFSIRAKRAGYNSYYLADILAHHEGGISSGQAGPMRLFYYLQSRLKYAKKHFKPLDYLILLNFTLGIEFVLRLLHALKKREYAKLRETLVAYWLLWERIISNMIVGS